MIKKIMNKLKEERGDMYILATFIIVFIFMCTYLFSLYYELKIITKGIRDTVQISTIKTITHNYSNVYRGTRQGYATAYKPLGEEEWQEIIDYGKIYEEMSSLLGLTEDTDGYVKYREDGSIEYKVSDLEVEVYNIEFGSLDTLNKFNADVTIHLEVPQSFLGIKNTLDIDLDVKAGYVNKF